MACEIRIGTSGYHYKHWRGPFYPDDLPVSKMREFYTRSFDTLELNGTFYRMPAETVFDKWREATPPDFSFAVKASRYLTHQKKLKDPKSALQYFLPRVAHLGPKLGPILFQLPPRWEVNRERLQAVLELLPRNLRCVFELRDPSWITADIMDLLARFRAAFCIYELAGYHTPMTVTTDFAYVRLHGPGAGKYQESYDRKRLRAWQRQIAEWARTLKAVYVYFDNDQAGYAVKNALTLKKMVAGEDARTKKAA